MELALSFLKVPFRTFFSPFICFLFQNPNKSKTAEANIGFFIATWGRVLSVQDSTERKTLFVIWCQSRHWMTLKFCWLSTDGLVPALSTSIVCQNWQTCYLFLPRLLAPGPLDSFFFHLIPYHRDAKEEKNRSFVPSNQPAPGNKKQKNPGRTRCQFHLHWVIQSVFFSFFDIFSQVLDTTNRKQETAINRILSIRRWRI